MKKYSGYIEGQFNYMTAVDAKSEKKAKKKAANELKDKVIKERIGTINKEIETIDKKDLEDLVDLFELTGFTNFDYLVFIRGYFNFGSQINAKNPDKAKDKLVKKLFKKCDLIDLGVETTTTAIFSLKESEVAE